MGQIFLLPLLRFPLWISFNQFSVYVFTYMLLFTERQRGESWEPFKKQRSFENWRVLIQEFFNFFFQSSKYSRISGLMLQAYNLRLKETNKTPTIISNYPVYAYLRLRLFRVFPTTVFTWLFVKILPNRSRVFPENCWYSELVTITHIQIVTSFLWSIGHWHNSLTNKCTI